MIYIFDTEDYDSPALLEQAEIDKDFKFFEDLQLELDKVKALYKEEMTQK